MTERTRSQIQAAEMSVLMIWYDDMRAAGVSLRDRVRSSVISERLGLEPQLLCVKRSQLRWFGHLVRMSPGCLPREVVQARPARRSPWGRPWSTWKDYISALACDDLWILPLQLVNVASEREVWVPIPDNWLTMNQHNIWKGTYSCHPILKIFQSKEIINQKGNGRLIQQKTISSNNKALLWRKLVWVSIKYKTPHMNQKSNNACALRNGKRIPQGKFGNLGSPFKMVLKWTSSCLDEWDSLPTSNFWVIQQKQVLTGWILPLSRHSRIHWAEWIHTPGICNVTQCSKEGNYSGFPTICH